MNEISRRTWWLLTAIVMSLAIMTVAVQSARLGFWEPFESAIVRAGIDEQIIDDAATDDAPTDDAADDGAADDDGVDKAAVRSPAVPTLNGEPLPVSWLKQAWVAQNVEAAPVVESAAVGQDERQARTLALLLAALLLGSGALWARHHLGEGAAALTVVILATSPIFFFGAVFLSSPLVTLAASTLCILAFYQSVFDGPKWRYLWAVLAAIALAVVALDERWIGVLSTLAVLVSFAFVEAIEGDVDDDQAGLDRRWAVGGMVAAAAMLGWAWLRSGDYDAGLVRPDLVQQMWFALPAVLLISFSLAARRRAVGRALMDGRGLIVALGGIIPLAILGTTYADVLPIDGDSVAATSPALAYLLESAQVGGEAAAAGDFSWWWRQVGFGLFPHFAFLIPAVAYLGWRLRNRKGDANSRRIARLCLVWPTAVFAVVALATNLGHTAFWGFFPLMVALGWMLSDAAFWRAIRRRPAFYLVIGIIAIFTVMILAKDYENFPARLFEFVIGGVDEPGLGESFEYGEPLSFWKKMVVAAMAAYFAGAISWAVFALGDIKGFGRWLRGLWPRFRKWRKKGPSAAPSEKEAATDLAETTGPTAGRSRMEAREQWRDKPGWLSAVAARLERQPGLVLLVVGMGMSFMALNMVAFAEPLTRHFSSRPVVETYLEVAEADQPLWRYRIDEEDRSFYVRGLEGIENRRQFNEFYGADQRFFSLIPADDLARVHSAVRRDHETSLAALATGGRLYLVSNALADGEEDVNPLRNFVLDEAEAKMVPHGVDEASEEGAEQEGQESDDAPGDEEPAAATFDNKIELVGYHLSGGTEGEDRPVIGWGDELQITMYFEVLRRIPRAQEIFMHIDLNGNRLHGDHDPVGGLYPTNYWLPGDIIKDVHTVSIDRFTTPGIYTIWTGFFRGDDRMPVAPEVAQDGNDRVNLTTFEVAPF